MKFYPRLLLFLFSISISAQTVVTTQPQYPTETDQITITFDITHQAKTLAGYAGSVYTHTGVYINNDNSSWKYVIGSWGNNSVQPQLTLVSPNVYRIVINNPRNFYGLTSSLEKITTLNFVLRSADATKQSEDIHVPLYSAGISIVLNSPTVNLNYGDPMRSPVFVSSGSTVPISVSTTVAGTSTLFINGSQVAQSATNPLNYSFIADNYSQGRNDIKIVAVDNANHKDSTQFVIFKNPSVKTIPLPSGIIPGINYSNGITLALYAPLKNFVYVISEYSGWKVDTTYFMNKSIPNPAKPDSVIWWLKMPSLTADPITEVAYQYLVDGTMRIYDPFTEKILDESNDKYIPSTVYPNLKSYPSGMTSGLISVADLAPSSYNWKVPNFTKPAKEKLVIYELLVRDFVSTHWYKTIIDTLSYFKKLGINAIELMPISEFDGNDSWGYNPTTYFAPDKYYGTKNDLKAFIDACHQNGIAVIQDIVLNHAGNSNSMAQLYWDNSNNRPAANNPWFNAVAPAGSYTFGGNDFNHESKDTKYFVDRVTSFWLTEYKIDGFRFDFSKGFTNTPGEGTPYDASRIAILKRIAGKIWNVAPGAYVILEHFCANDEEKELANYGMMLWGNLNSPYNQATMDRGNPSWDFSNIAYNSPFRNWSQPNLVGYMESHDEERLMYNNLQNGVSNISTGYNIKNLPTALNRIKLAATFFIPVPSAKMIWQFGELGYDISINQNGRVGTKPLPWSDGLNYYNDTDRKSLFNTFAALIRLKKTYPAFQSSDFVIHAGLSTKRILINHSSMNVCIIGNFDVYNQDMSPLFQSTGNWYEFFTGDTLTVTDVNMTINLEAGEYRLYTSKKIPKASILMDVKKEEVLPTDFRLEQNYPNPFNPSTVISYQLPTAGNVTLKVFDLLGREVVTLVDEFQQSGKYVKTFHRTSLPSGIYFYRIQAGNFASTKKMILLK